MSRYLLNISYIGTSFRGAQRQVSSKEPKVDDPTTVQGQLEIALKQLQPVNVPSVVTSSRTDSGVHALHSTVHVDLIRQHGLKYEPRAITIFLNRYFNQQRLPIRILSTYLVPTTFHCRSDAISRMYLYRLAVVKAEKLHVNNLAHHVPIEELERCMFLCTSTFDVEKAREAAELFVGRHDFRTFMNKSSKNPDKVTRRSIDMLRIEEGQSLCYSNYSWPYCSHISDYAYYNIYVRSPGFLYKQVRRTAAALVAVAQGKVTSRDIKFMLEVPSHRSWDSRIQTVPAHGLYLCEVGYLKRDLDSFEA